MDKACLSTWGLTDDEADLLALRDFVKTAENGRTCRSAAISHTWCF